MDQGRQRRRGIQVVSHWGAMFLVTMLAWGGMTTAASAQTATQFCYQGTTQQCKDTLDEAEDVMRAAPVNASIAAFLEQFEPTFQFAAPNANFIYKIKNQPASVLYTPSYQTGNGNSNEDDGGLPVGGHGCAPSADPNLGTNWCVDESELVGKAMEKYRTAKPECSFTDAMQVDDLRIAPYNRVAANDQFIVQYGHVYYGERKYRTTRTCPTGTKDLIFPIYKTATFTCAAAFSRLSDSVANDGIGDLTLPMLCNKPITAKIIGPVQQVGSCAVGKQPCSPATGDKVHVESDFTFAGRPFTRYYHSLHQFRTDIGSAVGWTHTFGDRMYGVAGSSPAILVDETGNYESFVTIAAGRYRGENSTDKVLESFSPGTVRWRLHLPGGELRDFDDNGLLLKIYNPADPRADATLSYAHGLLSTVTDGQGRKLQFEYSAAKLLSRITRPDGTTVDYGYDTNSNLTTVDHGDGQIKRYHYAEAGAIGDVSQRHHLTGITSETGARFATFKYDARGRTIESRAYGTPNDVTTVSYDSNTQATVTTAAGASREYTIQPGVYRRIESVQNAGEVSAATQTFDAEGRLKSSADRLGVVTNYSYDSSNAYRSAVDVAVGTSEQRREEVTRDPVSNLVTERRILDKNSALKAKTAWAYNARNQVTTVTVTDPADNATRTTGTTYCEASDVAAPGSTCPMLGLVKTIDGPRSDVVDSTTFLYRSADEPTCLASSALCPYRKGDLWKVINAQGHVVEVLAYDGAGRAKSLKDANGVTTDVEYSDRGWVLATKVRGTDNASETDDRIVRFDYWPDGSVQKVTQPDGTYLLFDYDDARRLTTIVDADGNDIHYTLNGAGDRVKEETHDAGGGLVRTLSRTYNTLRQLQAAHVPNSDSSNTTPFTTSFDYDDEGNLETMTDALARETRNEYDPLGRLTRTLQNATGGVDAVESTYHYDPLDRLIAVIDPNGLSTTYAYNGFGEQTRLESPDTGVSTYAYDSAGNRISQTDANSRTTAYSYDALQRLTDVDYAEDFSQGSEDAAFVYDIAQSDCPSSQTFLTGRLSRMTDGSGSTTYCYNRFGDLTRKVQRTQGKTFVLQWQYAANGRLQNMVYPDGLTVDYLYDGQGRIAEIGVANAAEHRQLLHSATYHPFGPVQQWTYGNGRVMQRSVNKSYQPGFVEDTTPGGISEGYWFDAVGNLESLQYADQGAPSRRFYAYDALNRLTGVSDGSHVLQQSYGYDKTGNRVSSGALQTVTVSSGGGAPGEPDPGETTTTEWATRSYTYYDTRHRLWLIGNTERHYDNAGNMTWNGPRSVEFNNPDPIDPSPSDPPPPGDPLESAAYSGTEQAQSSIGMDDGNEVPPGIIERVFAYNTANRMRSVTYGGQLLMNYRYNGKGERVYRNGSNETVHTVFDEAGHWLGDYDANGATIQQAIWFGDLPVGLAAAINGTVRLYYIQPDALGTPRVVIDPDRNVAVWRWDLAGEAFGDAAPDEDPDGDTNRFVLDMRFPGQQYDSATELNYNYFRDYDPSTGRYVQSDPIGLNGGISTYGYVGANPVVQIDPSGLVTVVIITTDHGVGSHAALYTSRGDAGGPALYDPAGNYPGVTPGVSTRGSGDLFGGDDANLTAYLNWQKSSGSNVTQYIFNTTLDEEIKIAMKAEDLGGAAPFFCADHTSTALQGAGPFKDLKYAFFPGSLADSLSNIHGVITWSWPHGKK